MTYLIEGTTDKVNPWVSYIVRRPQVKKVKITISKCQLGGSKTL